MGVVGKAREEQDGGWRQGGLGQVLNQTGKG